MKHLKEFSTYKMNEEFVNFDGLKVKFNALLSTKKDEFKKFVIKLKEELNNNKKAKNILVKYINKDAVNPDEMSFLKNQCIELIKTMGIGIPVAVIPGGIALLYFIIFLSKKFNIDIIPTILK